MRVAMILIEIRKKSSRVIIAAERKVHVRCASRLWSPWWIFKKMQYSTTVFFRVYYCFGQTLTLPGFVVYYFTIICLQLTLPWKAILWSHLAEHSSSLDLHLQVREIRASDPLFIFPDKRMETIKRLPVSLKTMKTNVEFYYFFFFS